MNNATSINRRSFIQLAAGAATMASARAGGIGTQAAAGTGRFQGTYCFFSKHLAGMDCSSMAKSLKEVGYTGVDLTTRKAGHVLPERAAEDLPKAVAAIREAGLAVPMITTELLSAGDPTAQPILCTAGKLGIPYFKVGYYRYSYKDILQELEKAGADLRQLVELGKQCGIQAGYHNHASYIGAPIWDMVRIIEPLDPKWAGYYFDIRHAVAEGGGSGWRIATKLIAPRIKMIAVKDFFWTKGPKGWIMQNCPLGEGMVDWREYFRMLAAANFQGPISMHQEYEPPGEGGSKNEKNVLAAAKKDLDFLKARIAEAYV
jgi:L-ribulose-5-phosphate 3-epimerase